MKTDISRNWAQDDEPKLNKRQPVPTPSYDANPQRLNLLLNLKISQSQVPFSQSFLHNLTLTQSFCN